MKKWTEISFKSKLLFATVVSAIMISTCATHEPKQVASDASAPECDSSCPLPAPQPKVVEQTIAQENWSFKLTGSDWKAREVPLDSIKTAMANDSSEMMVLFVKEEIGDATYAQYVISTIRAFAEGGAMVNSIKQVKLNDRKFILAQLSKDGEVIWAWITTVDGWGYGLTCGGVINVDAGAEQHDMCQAVADSLQIK
jgi:hypothetical protein